MNKALREHMSKMIGIWWNYDTLVLNEKTDEEIKEIYERLIDWIEGTQE